ncbi:MAG: RNA pseudouridine synthase [Verrucomicrobia bacterium]|nr:RNA pseudouridine synthase [Verrucomicrobiota bacterium]MDA1066571.1 RNA pseudouridine synthase [Verrucomicrobiota bacterium]
MPPSRKPFKCPPKRYQPRGVPVIYEDHDLIVVDKVSGLLTISTDRPRENTAYFLLNDYVRKGDPKSKRQLYIVHRLDKDTSGVIVFAKNEPAKRFLQDEWPNFQKKYFAVVHGKLDDKKDVITSYLAENSAYNMYSVKDPALGKLAKTGYKVLSESNKYSLLEIDLQTGRKNQIRVHFAEKGHHVVGDKLYGRKEEKSVKRLALHAGSLSLKHPFSKEKMTFDSPIPSYFRSLMQESKQV